jgi:hypothetical protein
MNAGPKPLECPGNSRIEICGIPHLAQSARADMGHPAVIAGTELDGEGRRRSAGSGAAKDACCDNICNQLPVDIGDGKGKAGAGSEIRRDGNRGDGAKALTIRARWLAQRRRCVRRCIRHGTHNAGMSAMSAAADGQQLLRRGEREHRRRRQQCPENAQQHKCCNPPHAMSLQQPQPQRSSTSWTGDQTGRVPQVRRSVPGPKKTERPGFPVRCTGHDRVCDFL